MGIIEADGPIEIDGNRLMVKGTSQDVFVRNLSGIAGNLSGNPIPEYFWPQRTWHGAMRPIELWWEHGGRYPA